MKKLMASLLLAGLLQGAFAQTTAKDKKIKELLELTGAGKLGVQMAQQLFSTFQAQYPDVPAAFWEKMQAEISAEGIIDLTLPIYGKYYSEEELNQLLKFYKTPLGQKVISVTPQIVQESMQAGRIWGQQLAEKIINELKENGYKKEA